MYLVYCFTNKINNKKYIGITSNIERRFKQHKSARNRCPVFSNAIKKYRFENFSFEIIKQNLSVGEAKFLEKQYIKDLNTQVPSGYNRTEGGNSSVKHTAETVAKIIEKNRLYNLKFGHPRIGKKHTEETKKLLSELAFKRENRPKGKDHWNYGQKAKDSTRKKMSEKLSLGKNPFAKKVIDLNTGIIYNCINEAKLVYGISHSFISMVCTGKRKSNKYKFMYLKDYEKKTSKSISR